VIRNCAGALILTLFGTAAAMAESPSLNKPLPSLSIADKGELVLENDNYSYQPWNSQDSLGAVHVLQYFAGTKSGSKIFEPFTDRLQVEFPEGGYHVTTVINLDDAMWGTSRFVISEVKASKREFPAATIVLDEEGTGKKTWELGKKGAVLAVMDRAGSVIYLSHDSLSEQEMLATLALMKKNIES